MRRLKRAMEAGEYTPTPVSVGLRAEHQKAVKYRQQADGPEVFSLDIDSVRPLPLTDGGHRLGALAELLDEACERRDRATDPATRARLETMVKDINLLPITCTVYLDGETRRDFVNLQAGRPVDASHLFSLEVRQESFSDPNCKLAFEVAEELHRQNGSPFYRFIRFDSRGELPLPVSTLCARGSSDWATSLVGLARVGADRFDVARLSGFVTAVFGALKTDAPDLLKSGNVLTPVGENGTKGSATMMIGLAVCLAHRVATCPELAEDGLMKELIQSARDTLDGSVRGRFSGQFKRERMSQFAATFFAAADVPKHQGVPVGLIRALSASALGVSPLPKEPKARTPRPKRNVTAGRAAENGGGAVVAGVDGGLVA